ncbi:MAG: aminoacetone oxidase family FAD-binding enzyme [Candidatus Gracilibacteria bacterium]
MKIAIIGAGPAGIFTSYFLKNFEGEIVLFEQNRYIGEKLKLTGGGRMNVTNKVFSVEEFSSSNKNLLKNLFKNPWIKNREKLFKELGIEYKWDDNRAILASESALDEVERLTNLLGKQKNLKIFTKCEVTNVKKSENKFVVEFENQNLIKEDFFDAVIITNGGMFRIKRPGDYKKMYKIPLELGHTITELEPSLCPIIVPYNPFIVLSGVSFKGKLFCPENQASIDGDILITHTGISGPAVLDFSSMIKGKKIELCFIGNLNEENFQKEFQRLRESKETVKSFIHKFLPNRICDFLMLKNGIKSDTKIATISKELFKKLQKDLFHYELVDVKLMDYQFAWTTKGGIPLNEINVSTLESRLHKNLYFAGEVLDVNGLCGGYNISFAAISGKIVSEAIMKNQNDI